MHLPRCRGKEGMTNSFGSHEDSGGRQGEGWGGGSVDGEERKGQRNWDGGVMDEGMECVWREREGMIERKRRTARVAVEEGATRREGRPESGKISRNATIMRTKGRKRKGEMDEKQRGEEGGCQREQTR